MIAVVGLPAYLALGGGEGTAGGLCVDVARAAAARGSEVQLMGKVGDDGAGDAVVMALGRLGIGHAALLRDPVHHTPLLSPVDVSDGSSTAGELAEGGRAAAETGSPIEELQAETEPDGAGGWRLLPDDATERPSLDGGDVGLALGYLTGATVVVAEPLPESTLAALAEGAAYSNAALVVLVSSGGKLPSLPPEATVLEAPAADDGSFGRLVGEYAAGLDSGLAPAKAFAAAVEASGWEEMAP